MTARECLRHRWLTSNRKISSKSSTSSQEVSTQSDPTRRVGCSSCQASTNQKNLRRYLSKSREALFEKVISRSKDQPQENLRKSMLMSPYNKTRRMCESQMSLLSKSRERLVSDQKSMSPSLHKSREKLYGLRSLSKSHEVLNLCKTVGGLNSELNVPESSPLRGILKSLTKGTSAESPLAREELAESNIKTVSVPDKHEQSDSKKEQVYDIEKLYRFSSSDLKGELTNDNDLKHTVVPPEVQPLQSVLTFICKNSINKDLSMEDSNKENVATDLHNEEHCKNNTKEENNNEKKERHKPRVLITKQISIVQSDEDPQSPDGNLDSLSLTGTSTSCSEISDEDARSLERLTFDFSTEEDEPRYTVAQLVSAYNLHQEIVTKCSLEVTMNSDNVETKIPPLIEKVPNKKFPTGPNALRLFIPNIDIASRCAKRSAKKKSTMRSAAKKIDELNEEIKEKSIDDLTSTAIEIPTEENNVLSHRLSDLDILNQSGDLSQETNQPFLQVSKQNLEKDDTKVTYRLTNESPTKSFVRSSSISSEASFKSSGGSSNTTTSMEELSTPDRKPRSNRSSGIASSDGDHPNETWTMSATSSVLSKTSDKLLNSTPRPNRKSFCNPRVPAVHTDSKTRRKSSPVMKPFY